MRFSNPMAIALCALSVPVASATPHQVAPDGSFRVLPYEQVRAELGGIGIVVQCPNQRDFDNLDEASAAARRRSIRIELGTQTERYRDNAFLFSILFRARDLALERCPISFPLADRIVQHGDGGGIDIYQPGPDGEHVVRVGRYTMDEMGPIEFVGFTPQPDETPSETVEPPAAAPEESMNEPQEESAASPAESESKSEDQPEQQTPSQAAPHPAEQNGGEEEPADEFGFVLFVILVSVGALLLIASSSGKQPRPAYYSPPRHPIDDIVDEAIQSGGRVDIDALKTTLRHRPSDTDEQADRERALREAAARMRTDEARLNAALAQQMREAQAAADRSARSSSAYDLTPTEAQLLRATLKQQAAAARTEALRKGSRT